MEFTKNCKKIEVQKFNMILYYFLSCIFLWSYIFVGEKSLCSLSFMQKEQKEYTCRGDIFAFWDFFLCELAFWEIWMPSYRIQNI